MAEPTNRQEFGQYCLRRLGAPAIEINVTDEQIDDRIDDALNYYWDYHFDGTEKQYYKHQITEDDKTNKYITMPDNIIGVVKLFDYGSIVGSANMFSIQYQIAMNDLYNMTNINLVPYYMAMQHLQLIEEVLIGKKPIRYNRNRNMLHIDMNWNLVEIGHWLIVEAYQIVDPEVYPDVWKDRWLKEYCTQLIKRQMAETLSKYKGGRLPDGSSYSAQEWKDEANAKIDKLEAEMINSYSIPATTLIG